MILLLELFKIFSIYLAFEKFNFQICLKNLNIEF